jgi:hypothetical protein
MNATAIPNKNIEITANKTPFDFRLNFSFLSRDTKIIPKNMRKMANPWKTETTSPKNKIEINTVIATLLDEMGLTIETFSRERDLKKNIKPAAPKITRIAKLAIENRDRSICFGGIARTKIKLQITSKSITKIKRRIGSSNFLLASFERKSIAPQDRQVKTARKIVRSIGVSVYGHKFKAPGLLFPQ